MLRTLTRVRLPHDPLERATVLMARTVAALILVVFLSWLAGYLGRWDTVHDQRAACESRKLDQTSTAVAWGAATIARKADDRPVERAAVAVVLELPERTLEAWGLPKRGMASDLYGATAVRLAARSREDCAKRYGAPSIIPLP